MENRYAVYSENNIRSVANRLVKKYSDLREQHIYWIAKELNIYPDAIQHKKSKSVDIARTGKINRNNTEYVSGGRLNEKGIQAIESYLMKEGYKIEKFDKGEQMEQNKNIWEQVDLISKMKGEYDKAVAARDSAKAEADQYCQLADKYEKEIEELKDRLLISEKENNDLKTEKKELGQLQLKQVDFGKEIESLQKRIGQYNAEINAYSADVNELRKEVAALQTCVNQLQEKKKKLEGVISDLIGCSKRLMNMK